MTTGPKIFSLLFLRPLLFIGIASTFSCSFLAPQRGMETYKNKFHRLWIKNNDPVYSTGNLPIALNSPLLHEGIVFVGHNEGKTVAYDSESGDIIWEKKENGTHHGAPVIYKDLLIYGNVQGRVYARNYLTGELKYSVDLGAGIETKGVIARGRIYFHLRNHQIFALDVLTGKILWAHKRSVPFATTLQRASRPLVHKNKLYIGTADGSVLAFNIEDGVVLWETKTTLGTKFVDVDTSPVLRGKQLLVGSLGGQLALLDLSSGKLLRSFHYSISRSPIKINGHYLLGTSQGELVLLDNNLNELKKVKLSSHAITSMALWKGHIVASNTSGKLFLVDKKRLTPLDSLYLGHATSAVFGELSTEEGKLAVLSSRNRLYLFK